MARDSITLWSKELEKVQQFIMLEAQVQKKKLSEARPSVTMKMEVWTRSEGRGQNKRYVFRISGKEFEAPDDSTGSVRDISRVWSICCKKLNEKRGYLVQECVEDFWYQTTDCFGYTSRSMEITVGLTFLTKPCKEFEALKRYMTKNANIELGDLDLYSVSITGKRGTNYSENGERSYYAHRPKMCKSILEWLARNKRPQDRLKVDIREKRDCEDEDYSRRYETESYGSFHRYLDIRTIDKDGNRRAELETWYNI